MLDSLPTDFDFYLKWSAIATLATGTLAVLAFLFSWGIRFRLVGTTGFLGVVTVGIFALSLGLFRYASVPGAVPYKLVYDSGNARAVIKLPDDVSETEVDATLRQAAADLFSFGRLGGSDRQLLVRARTVVHPEPGITKPVYLGQVRRSLVQREDATMEVEIFSEQFAQLPEKPTPESQESNS